MKFAFVALGSEGSTQLAQNKWVRFIVWVPCRRLGHLASLSLLAVCGFLFTATVILYVGLESALQRQSILDGEHCRQAHGTCETHAAAVDPICQWHVPLAMRAWCTRLWCLNCFAVCLAQVWIFSVGTQVPCMPSPSSCLASTATQVSALLP